MITEEVKDQLTVDAHRCKGWWFLLLMGGGRYMVEAEKSQKADDAVRAVKPDWRYPDVRLQRIWLCDNKAEAEKWANVRPNE